METRLLGLPQRSGTFFGAQDRTFSSSTDHSPFSALLAHLLPQNPYSPNLSCSHRLISVARPTNLEVLRLRATTKDRTFERPSHPPTRISSCKYASSYFKTLPRNKLEEVELDCCKMKAAKPLCTKLQYLQSFHRVRLKSRIAQLLFS